MNFSCSRCAWVWKREEAWTPDLEATPAKNVGRKDDTQKARYDLVPPESLEAIVQALTYGAGKYGDSNWRLVQNGRARYFAAMMRHSWAYFRGEKADPETGLPHLAHAGACLMFLLSKLEGDA